MHDILQLASNTPLHINSSSAFITCINPTQLPDLLQHTSSCNYLHHSKAQVCQGLSAVQSQGQTTALIIPWLKSSLTDREPVREMHTQVHFVQLQLIGLSVEKNPSMSPNVCLIHSIITNCFHAVNFPIVHRLKDIRVNIIFNEKKSKQTN